MNQRSLSSHLRSIIVLIVVSYLLTFLAYFLINKLNLDFNAGVIVMAVWILSQFALFWFSDSILLKLAHVKLLSREDAPELFVIVDEVSQRISVPVPEIYLQETPVLNAFAVGRSPSHGAVVFTRGILSNLTKEEIRFVVGHELSHIKHRDTLMMAAIAVLVGGVQLASEVVFRSDALGKLNKHDRSGYLQLVYFCLLLLSPFVAIAMQMALSRNRELLADNHSVNMVGGKEFAVSGLKKLGLFHFEGIAENRILASLCINESEEKLNFIDKMFATHPPLSERIKAIEQL